MEKTMDERSILEFKAGTTSLTNEQGIDINKVDHLAGQLAVLGEAYRLMGTVSGSIAMGRLIWREEGKDDEHLDDQLAAMVGSARLIEGMRPIFADYGITVGQLLFTHFEIDTLSEGNMMRDGLEKSWRHKNVLILGNENDALSLIEIKRELHGEGNDGLSSHKAQHMGADKLLYLTDTAGLMDKDGNLIREVGSSHEAVAAARSHIEDNGKGELQGMFSKFDYSHEARQLGIHAMIANIMADYQVVLAGGDGTHFLPDDYRVQ